MANSAGNNFNLKRIDMEIERKQEYKHKQLANVKLKVIRPHVVHDGHWVCRLSVGEVHLTDALIYCKDIMAEWSESFTPAKEAPADGGG